MSSTTTSTAGETDAFITVHAHAGNARPGELPDETYPALLNVRPFRLDDGTPAVVVTATCQDSAVMGIDCDDAIALGDRLRDLTEDREGRHRNVAVQGPAVVRTQIPRMSVGLADGVPVFRAGPTYVLDDTAARMLAAALITSGVWAKATAEHAAA